MAVHDVKEIDKFEPAPFKRPSRHVLSSLDRELIEDYRYLLIFRMKYS
jgi:hypothetical protein